MDFAKKGDNFEIINSKWFGGKGGGLNDLQENGILVEKIGFCKNYDWNCLEGIFVQLRNGKKIKKNYNYPPYTNNKYKKKQSCLFSFDENENINSIQIYSKKMSFGSECITRCIINTNKKVIDWGFDNGKKESIIFENAKLCGVQSKVGALMDGISFSLQKENSNYVKNIVQNNPNIDLPEDEGKFIDIQYEVVKLDWFGGKGGGWERDFVDSGIPVESIGFCKNFDWNCLEGIYVKLQNGKEIQKNYNFPPYKNNNLKQEQSCLFLLEDCEYIRSIQCYSKKMSFGAECITRCIIATNMKIIDWGFNNGKGTKFVFENAKLCGVHCKIGALFDGLSFYLVN